MPSLQDQLHGTYRLISLVTTTTTGEVSRPMGDEPTGMFVFDGAGNYSVFETPPFTVDGVEATTVITWRRVADPA